LYVLNAGLKIVNKNRANFSAKESKNLGMSMGEI